MRTAIFTPLILIAGAQASTEIYGKGTVIGGPPALCLIQTYWDWNPERTLPSPGQPYAFQGRFAEEFEECSGTLTAENEITTAGHCLEYMGNPDYRAGKVAVRFSCNLTSDSRSKNLVIRNWQWVSSVSLSDKMIRTNRVLDTKEDVAKLFLSADPSAKRPIPMEIGTRSEFLALPAETECRIAGLGWNAQVAEKRILSAPVVFSRLKYSGKPYETILSLRKASKEALSSSALAFWNRLPQDAGKLSVNVGNLLRHSKDRKAFDDFYIELFGDGAFTSGDSGGPLFCRPNKTSEWKLYGINVGDVLYDDHDKYHPSLNSVLQWAPADTVPPVAENLAARKPKAGT